MRAVTATVLPLLVLGACSKEPEKADKPDRSTYDILEVPDLTGIDFIAAYTDAFVLATTVTAAGPWDSHVDLLANRDPGCPDIYTGIPDGDIDELDDGMGGSSWIDFCETGVQETWAGYAWWDSDASSVIDQSYPDINTQSGIREMIADASITTDSGAIWEFDGELSEAVNYTIGTGYTDWTWSSLVVGTFSGDYAFAGTELPSGWRTDLYIEASKGDTGDHVEARGNVYMHDARLHTRFDSIVMDLEILGDNALGPEGCASEPLGWIGLRDENAVWYDLVFLPRTEGDVTAPPYDNPNSVCDGCGTLYVRGVESGEVCMDFKFALDETLIVPPPVQDFVLVHRGLP